MKKPNENIFPVFAITPDEEKVILLSFERYVATYTANKKQSPKKQI